MQWKFILIPLELGKVNSKFTRLSEKHILPFPQHTTGTPLNLTMSCILTKIQSLNLNLKVIFIKFYFLILIYENVLTEKKSKEKRRKSVKKNTRKTHPN